jgi:hypothetical protein
LELIKLTEQIEPSQFIDSFIKILKDKDSKHKREENITRINLNKYWKEPMAWH